MIKIISKEPIDRVCSFHEMAVAPEIPIYEGANGAKVCMSCLADINTLMNEMDMVDETDVDGVA